MEPVVYFFRNVDDEIIYVGTSQEWPLRLRAHSRNSRWFSEVARIDLKKFDTAEAALQAEADFIWDLKPKYNKRIESHYRTLGVTEPSQVTVTDKSFSHGTSGVRNVVFHRASGRWAVQVNKNRKAYRGGYYDTLEEAAQVAKDLRRRLYPESNED